MSSPLTSLFREVHKIQFSNPLADALQERLLGKIIDSHSILRILDHIEKEGKISTFLQSFFVLVFLVKEKIYAHQKPLQDFLAKHIDPLELFDENLLLYQLILFYLNPGSKEKTFQSNESDLSAIPMFQEETLSATFSMLLGYLTKEEVYFDLAKKHMTRVEAFLDHRRRPILTLWCKEEDYDPFSFLCGYYLLLQLKGEPITAEKKEIYSLIQEEHFSSSLLFYIALEKIVQNIPKSSISFTLDTMNKMPDLLSWKNDHFTCLCTVTGMHSSLGVFRGDKIECRAFGPQYYPLDDSRGFGIHRPPWLREGALKIEEDQLSFNGWFPMTQEMGKNWSEVCIDAKNKNLTLSFQLFGEKEAGMAFYMKAERCQIGNKEMLPQTIQHCKESVSEIFFTDGNEKISMIFDQKRDIECVSLAGKNYFWNSDYLLFLPNKNKEKISLTVSYY